MNRILAVVLAAYSAISYWYWYTHPEFKPTLSFWAQFAAASLGASLYTLYEILPFAKKYVKKIFSSLKIDEKDEVNKRHSCCLLGASSQDMLDFDCLCHLKRRFTNAESQEGIDLVEKINTLLFRLPEQSRQNIKDNS